MHETQRKILQIARKKELGELSLRQIGELIGVKHPQKVKHHLETLIDRGFLDADAQRQRIRRVSPQPQKDGLFAIPILGNANAGPATAFADEDVAGYLRISKQLVPKSTGNLFAIKVSGESMNRASVRNKNIENGDFVIVDPQKKTPETGDVILSIIGDVANIKRFTRDQSNNQIILSSESNQDFAPIYIHEEDQSDYQVAGTIVDVFKKP